MGENWWTVEDHKNYFKNIKKSLHASGNYANILQNILFIPFSLFYTFQKPQIRSILKPIRKQYMNLVSHAFYTRSNMKNKIFVQKNPVAENTDKDSLTNVNILLKRYKET